MPDYAQQREREIARREPFQQRPEWKDWLSRQDDGLEDFFTRVVPDMPADPYSAEGLRHAESAALKIFPDSKAASPTRSPENLDRIDPFQRYLGEVYIRCFEGHWLNLADTPGEVEPAVETPYGETYHQVRTALTRAMSRRTGEEWAVLFGNQLAIYQRWQRAGRPALADWVALQDREWADKD